MKILLILAFLLAVNTSCYAHCGNSCYQNSYRPPSTGFLPCGCSYYSRKKFVGWDCNRKPIYRYVKISSHKRCRERHYVHNRYKPRYYLPTYKKPQKR